jgi:hypothetical protein
VQRERDAVKRAEAAEKKLHGAEVRAEAAEFNFQSHVKSTLEARKERDDLRARLAKLLAATALYVQAIDTGFGPMGKSNEDLLFAMRNAIAEARSGATDAPPAATPARERLRQDVKRRETRCNGTFDDIQALLNEPAAADGWEAMRELRDTLQSRCNAMRAATENEYHDSTRAHCYAWANGLNEAMLEIDRLLSRSLANKHGAEV